LQLKKDPPQITRVRINKHENVLRRNHAALSQAHKVGKLKAHLAWGRFELDNPGGEGNQSGKPGEHIFYHEKKETIRRMGEQRMK